MANREAVITVVLDPAFGRLMQRQREFQHAMGHVPTSMTTAEQQEYLRTQFLAMIAEATEAMNETNWKPWTTPPTGSVIINYERYRGELVDVYIFLMNLMFIGGITVSEFAIAVDDKITKNIQRQADGYDGKNKCPECKRAYDDAGVECRRVISPGHPEQSWCAEKDRSVFPDNICPGCQTGYEPPRNGIRVCFPGSDPSYSWCVHKGGLVDRNGALLP
jgi:hypothetical protein